MATPSGAAALLSAHPLHVRRKTMRIIRALTATTISLLFGCYNPVSDSERSLYLNEPFVTTGASGSTRIVFPSGEYIPIAADRGGVYYTIPGQFHHGTVSVPGGVYIPNPTNKKQGHRFYMANDRFLKSRLKDNIPFSTDGKKL